MGWPGGSTRDSQEEWITSFDSTLAFWLKKAWGTPCVCVTVYIATTRIRTLPRRVILLMLRAVPTKPRIAYLGLCKVTWILWSVLQHLLQGRANPHVVHCSRACGGSFTRICRLIPIVTTHMPTSRCLMREWHALWCSLDKEGPAGGTFGQESNVSSGASTKV